MMSTAEQERVQAAQLPDDDVVAILLRQHARIRDLFMEVKITEGDHKQQVFDELRALLAVHETGEEMVLRPVSRETAGSDVAEARNREEKKLNQMLAELEKMNVHTAEFDARLVDFEKSVIDHAEHEEREEFPALRPARFEEDLVRMGKRLRAAERFAPTHPHPAVAGSPKEQWMVGPFASIVDRVKDAVK